MMRDELLEWRRFVRSETHILRERPSLVFQQAANQPASTAPSIAAQRRLAGGTEKRPWLRWINKPLQLEPESLMLSGHGTSVESCAFSPDGKRVLSWAKKDPHGQLKTWDAETGEELTSIDVRAFATRASAFSSDATMLALGEVGAGGKSRIRILRTTDAETMVDLPWHEGEIECCAFSTNGAFVISGYHEGILVVWDIAAGNMRASLKPHKQRIHQCAISADGKRVASATSSSMLRSQRQRTSTDSATMGSIMNRPRDAIGVEDGQGCRELSAMRLPNNRTTLCD